MKRKRSKIIDDILDSISPEEQKAIDEKLEKQHQFLLKLQEEGKIWGTPTSYSLDVIRKHGYNPIAITTIICEETFIFKTDEEASKAYEDLEINKGVVDGWWYGEEKFKEEHKTLDNKPKIHKL